METWNDVFKAVIMLVIALAGAPVTQLFKNTLSLIFKKPVEDRWALLLTGAVAALFALAEQSLAGVLDFKAITTQNFPTYFAGVFTLASVYYGWMKNSESKLGAGFLLKKTS